jgi:hypothetical protein
MPLELPHLLDAKGARADDPELETLRRAAADGVAVAPVLVVPSGVEADFYRLNNLPQRLAALFDGVDLDDPDEDDIDEIAPEAQALVGSHALLEEVVEALYERSAELGAELVVRRAGSAGTRVPNGRPALLALKRTWIDDWSAEALLERLVGGRGLAPPARPVLFHGPEARRAEAFGTSAGIGEAWVDEAGRLVRVTTALRHG